MHALDFDEKAQVVNPYQIFKRGRNLFYSTVQILRCSTQQLKTGTSFCEILMINLDQFRKITIFVGNEKL